MKSLYGLTSGAYLVSTESGAEYLLDLDVHTMNRRLPTGSDDSMLVLRRDEQPVALLSLLRCTVGEEMRLIIDLRVAGVLATTRVTTPVTRIAPVEVVAA